ncbi:MAG: VOC family protein [Pyrinomonadaceae bacterium]
MSNPSLGNGKICYVEIPATDIATSAEFYRAVFGWQTVRAATAASPSTMASVR